MIYEKEELIFKIVSKDFLKFCQRYLFPYLETPYIEESYYHDWNELINQRDPFNKPNRQMLRWLELISRGHSKTLIPNIFLNIYDATTNPNLSQALGSATNPQTKEIADKLKRTLLKSPYLRYKYVPEHISKLDEKTAASTVSSQWNNEKIILKNGSIIYFRSMKQEWSGLHLQKITLDDAVAKKQSKLSDEECIRTFQYDILPTAKSLKADLIIIGTHVRSKDLLQHIKNKLPFFKTHEFKAIKKFEKFKNLTNEVFLDNELDHLKGDFSGQCQWLMKNQKFNFSKGKELQKELLSLCMSKRRFGWKGYMQAYAEMGHRAFMREFQLEIQHTTNNVIGKEFLERAKNNGSISSFIKQRHDFITKLILTWDFSFSKSENADKTSCVAAWKDKRYKKTIFLQLLWNVQPNEFPNWKQTLINKIKEFHKQYKADVTVPEANSILQLTDDFNSLGVPIMPVWTGSSDTTSKAKLNKRNFGNMITIDKTGAIERLGTEFEQPERMALVSGIGAEESAETLIEQLSSWAYDEEEEDKIIESGVHPDAGICCVLANEYFRHKGGVKKVIGGFL